MKPEEIAHALHEAHRGDAMYPDSVYGHLDIPAAYRAQFDLLRLREADGARLVGWKVGLTSKAMQAQQNVHEPCFGHLLASGHLASPAALDFGDLIAPGFENELCLEIGQALDGPRVTRDQARAAIASVAPALEIVEKRGVFGDDFPLAIAGNAQQRNFVTGAFMPLDPKIDLAATTVAVSVNDTERERATGAEVLGDPVNSVLWLVEALSRHGRGLRAGDRIMSGSFTKQYPLAAGDRVRVRFEPFGAVALDCV